VAARPGRPGCARHKESWFIKIELELTTGRTFRSTLTSDETKELAKGFIVMEDQPDSNLALVRAAFNTLAYRPDDKTADLILPDADGRAWLFHRSSMVAFGFEHRLDTPGKRVIEFDFRAPVVRPSERKI
jgi:hypothetical protein